MPKNLFTAGTSWLVTLLLYRCFHMLFTHLRAWKWLLWIMHMLQISREAPGKDEHNTGASVYTRSSPQSSSTAHIPPASYTVSSSACTCLQLISCSILKTEARWASETLLTFNGLHGVISQFLLWFYCLIMDLLPFALNHGFTAHSPKELIVCITWRILTNADGALESRRQYGYKNKRILGLGSCNRKVTFLTSKQETMFSLYTLVNSAVFPCYITLVII
jgi:hypothetical protein